MPLSGLQQRGYCHSLGYSRGDTATLWVIAEGILPLSVIQRGCYHFQGYSRGDATTLWVMTEGILPLSQLGYSRRDKATVCLSEGMLQISWLYQRGHCLSVREREYTPCIMYIYIYTIHLHIYIYILYVYIYTVYLYILYIYIYIYTYISLHGLQGCTIVFQIVWGLMAERIYIDVICLDDSIS